MAAGVSADDITRSPLGAVRKDAAGVLSPEVSGIPASFWGDTSSQTLHDLIPPYSSTALPEARALLRRIMLAQITPPLGQSGAADLLLGRVDHLFESGALDQADALLSAVVIDEPALFDRWFDVNLLLRQPDRACLPAHARPALATEINKRVYCLAQNGDWSAAATALSLGATIGAVSPEDTDLLSKFLDAEEFEDLELAPAGELTPLSFVLRHDLGEPARTRSLPLPYLAYTLHDALGWRDQIQATERLVASGAISPAALGGIYTQGRASASGGVWERVQVVQAILSDLETGSVDDLAALLDTAWMELGPRDLLPALGDLVTERLAYVDFPPAAEAKAIQLMLLAQDESFAEPFVTALPPENPLYAIFSDSLIDMQADTQLFKAIKSAFAADTPLPTERQTLLDSNRQGEAVLRALAEISDGINSDPQSVKTALQTLLYAGFSHEARRLALQFVILSEQVPI